MAGRLPRVTGATGVIDTAAEGFVLLPCITPHAVVAGLIAAATNETRAFQFILPLRITFSKIITAITTGGASGKKYGAGIYDKDKNLIIETGALDAEAVAINSTSVTVTTLEPGVYWMAQTTDDAATQGRGFSATFADVWDLANKNNSLAGVATAGSAGVLPATLGSISAGTGRAPIAIIIER